MRSCLTRTVPVTTVLAILISSILAAPPPTVPHQFAYQGKLTDNTGTPVPNGLHQVVFRVWNDSSSADPVRQVWSSGKVEVATNAGLFSINLGAAPQPEPTSDIFMDTSLWLGVTVGDDPELSPRTKLTSVPYAFKAEQANAAITAQNANISASVAPNSVSSGEIVDEPGIAASQSTDTVNLRDCANMVDVVSISITIPSSGYIVVEGRCTGVIYSLTSAMRGGVLQIDDSAGGPRLDPYATEFAVQAYPSNLPAPDYTIFPVSVHRVYFKSAGTHAFRLEGCMKECGPGANIWVKNSMIKATYYPTSYGTVTTLVSSSEAGQFEKAEEVSVPTGHDGIGPATTMYQVDLREL